MSRRILRRVFDLECLPAATATLHPALRRVYAARGVEAAEDLDLGLERLLPMSTLGGVEAAVDLLLACHRTGGKVLVVGDFDADGATSTAVVIRQLRRLGFVDPGFLVPDRFKFGYGLTPEIVRVAAQRRPALIVTVDNGISSIEGVEEAQRGGIPVLITDHHLPGRPLPAAAAIVNPNAPGERFASKALAGVGVAFYVVAALTRRMREAGLVGKAADVNAADLLDLVALGTVADVVPLDLNNRILVAQGLRRIRAGRCAAGLRALLESAGRRLESVVAQDLGFQAGPRLNAAGRLEDMSLGIECLLTADASEARELASRLAKLNSDRREIEFRMQQEALAKVDELVASLEGGMPAGLCLYDAGWHQGVIGLVASRIKERVHRPVIAFAPGDPGWVKGSARSVPGVHVRDALDAVATRNPGLLEKFGGHAMAAGMTLRAARLAEFGQAFADEIARRIDEDTLTGDLHTDGPLLPGEFNADTAIALREAGPWGSGFPEPSFDGRFGVAATRIVGDRHLKLRLKTASGEAVDAIAFRYLDDARAEPVREGQDVEMVYRTELDEYGGARRMQLVSEWLRTLP
ncbi:MAG: single-stranded-DNA-specific exonuclease RecJ [Steroidobacteraceae bacterium]